MNLYEDFSVSFRHLSHPSPCQRKIFCWRLLRLLNEAMKHYKRALMEAQKRSDPLAREVGANLPQSALEVPHERHSDWPAELDPHQIHSNRTSVCFVEAA